MFRGRCLLFAAAMKVSGLPQCQRCWRWGHRFNVKSCPFRGLSCPICGEPHHINNHRDYASCCKGDAKSTPPHEPTPKGQPCSHSPRCVNCGKPHRSDSSECRFWKSRFDHQWIWKRYHNAKVNPLLFRSEFITNPPSSAVVW